MCLGRYFNPVSPPPILSHCSWLILLFLFQIILFEGSETSKRDFLLRDSLGRFMSRLIVRRIEHSHAGLYTCQPASAQPATVTVHVLNGTVLAVADGNLWDNFNTDLIRKRSG